MNNGNVFRVGYATENARIIRIVGEGLKNPTIIVVTTQSTIEKIKVSKDPMITFRREIDIGNLTISGQNLATKVKLSAVLSSDSVLWFFYNILFG